MNADPSSSSLAVTRFGSGQAVHRLEDDALLSGRGQYADDVRVDGQLHLAFVRSPYPHARIVSVDTSTAAGMPGVARVLTGAELVAAGVKQIPGVAGFVRADGSPGATPPRYALAHERVRYLGEAVAAVLADSVQQARDAAEAVFVEYEELPVVVDHRQATAPGAPVIWDAAPDNISAEMRHGDAAAAFHRKEPRSTVVERTRKQHTNDAPTEGGCGRSEQRINRRPHQVFPGTATEQHVPIMHEEMMPGHCHIDMPWFDCRAINGTTHGECAPFVENWREVAPGANVKDDE